MTWSATLDASARCTTCDQFELFGREFLIAESHGRDAMWIRSGLQFLLRPTALDVHLDPVFSW
jgi:hypothetical protein